jgi:hypothetical protein
MAHYEYEYVRADGVRVVVERVNVPMAESDTPVEVLDDTDKNTYIATRILSLTADMSLSWDEDIKASDLPPKHYGPEDVARDRAAKRGRKKQAPAG